MSSKTLFAVLVVFIFTQALASKISLNYNRKQLAGPPSDFKDHIIPNPVDASVQETTAEIEVLLNIKDYTGGADLLAQNDVVCDSKQFVVVFFSPYEEKVVLKLFNPNGNEVNLDGKLKKDIFPIGDSSDGVPALYCQLEDAIIGTYVLKVYAKPGQVFQPIPNNPHPKPNAYIMTYSESPLVIFTHVNQFAFKVGEDVGLLTRIGDTRLPMNGNAPTVAKGITIQDAEMDVENPDGTEFSVKMHDDGLHHDFEANDGIYGATFKPTASGMHRLRADVVGKTVTGDKFIRSTQHLAPVIENDISFTGKAIGRFTDPSHVVIELLLKNTAPVDETYIAYAEVWGLSRILKKEVAVCWIEGLADIGNDAGTYYVPLNLDLSWLRLSDVDAVDYSTLFLKNVRVQDVDYSVPLTTANKVTITFPKMFGRMILQLPIITEITSEMRYGPVPESIKMASLNRTMDNGKTGVVVVHGYCSKDNPFSKTTGWNDAYFLNDLNNNKNNMQFGKTVMDFATSKGLDSYSIVGHSQGGMVGLEILNFFYSGLDVVKKSGRLVQAIGTPYYGNSGAGCWADLINIFGFGCGANFDLSKEGAALWLSTISKSLTKEVHYYTTSYGKFPYCNFLTYLVLKKPNDGTAEVPYCHLEGAVNLGNTDGQCHTDKMSKPAQTHDAKRNAEMSTKAAR